jgi:hypothetical protein
MIASPSDVAAERQKTRDIIHEWNAIHSTERQVVLLPVGWETHSSPSMEDRAQSVINKQVLTDCDLLVAVFWTRLGSPTGEAVSGTVEEIQEHISAGKPAMLYFSDVPVQMGSVDNEQYQALLHFKKECLKKGLVEVYESISEFHEKFRRQLTQTINRDFNEVVGKKEDSLVERIASQLMESTTADTLSSIEELSVAAKVLLKEASKDRQGTIMFYRTLQGLGVETNGKNFVESNDPREEAKRENAVQELIENELIQDRGWKGEVYGLTLKGFKVADQIIT